ncbi:hypothetical protein P4388_24715 [Bacillus thuringiensis]|uniref:SunI/YnzG family protein n=1 Tax=Bacillus thuringiensis TaxID=1428 RepID=UPI000A365C81|nr:hypothetical protein [Bacillus thuringiensis]MEB8653322.1 hypothetical protein [Bacillus cereus]MEB8671096.1 hypothetical protein [Bacillus cereus]MED3351787.1 hypothetical protein [Bacillus thuringiensis]MRB11977.1 hypothetical protein [Bacillus thuringiensis]OTW87139.1 hypothetical protein BK710_12700 [Bacillus thuringiensis serovar sumiyoshiensis]
MLNVNVQKSDEYIMVKWQSAEINIPVKDIINITTNDTSLKKLDHVVYIGIPSPSKKKVIIKTKILNYVLFTPNTLEILDEINSQSYK